MSNICPILAKHDGFFGAYSSVQLNQNTYPQKKKIAQSSAWPAAAQAFTYQHASLKVVRIQYIAKSLISCHTMALSAPPLQRASTNAMWSGQNLITN